MDAPRLDSVVIRKSQNYQDDGIDEIHTKVISSYGYVLKGEGFPDILIDGLDKDTLPSSIAGFYKMVRDEVIEYADTNKLKNAMFKVIEEESGIVINNIMFTCEDIKGFLNAKEEVNKKETETADNSQIKDKNKPE